MSIPVNNTSGISRKDTTYRIPVGGRVHNILYNGIVLFKGKLHRKQIEGTQYSSIHVAQAEILGLIERDLPYQDCRGKTITYTITSIGYAAFKILHAHYYKMPIPFEELEVQIALGAVDEKFHLIYRKPIIYVVCPIKINQVAYDYHENRRW